MHRNEFINNKKRTVIVGKQLVGGRVSNALSRYLISHVIFQDMYSTVQNMAVQIKYFISVIMQWLLIEAFAIVQVNKCSSSLVTCINLEYFFTCFQFVCKIMVKFGILALRISFINQFFCLSTQVSGIWIQAALLSQNLCTQVLLCEWLLENGRHILLLRIVDPSYCLKMVDPSY